MEHILHRVIPAALLIGFVVHRGFYTRWIRHPIYAAFLLILGSLLLIAANWFIGGLWLAMTGLDVTSRIRTEEAMMLRQFKEQYRAYMRRTGRLFPRLARRKGTEEKENHYEKAGLSRRHGA